MERNYFNDIMNDIQEILYAENVDWPNELNNEDKVKLLNSAIEYFTKVEEYEKCKILHDQIAILASGKKPRQIKKK